MSDIVIRIDNLSKRYRLGQRESYRALRDVLAETIAVPARRISAALKQSNIRIPKQPDNLFWALKDVSFTVRRGEVVGIIGRNGAGKSTLLKILSRITKPTNGYAEIRGRVGSLLEVGTGFHPELTGRENIYLNGAMLGMKRAEINRKFDEIIDFSEVEKFLDTPVKRYSSGMYMRLAFAVAAHLEPEILVVDEVLAVGDAAFQKKCLGKMGEVAREGRTVLFVSHNMSAIQQLTRTSVLLNKGTVVALGPSAEIISQYMETSIDRTTSIYYVENTPRPYPELGRQIEFISLELEQYETKIVPADADISVKICVRANAVVDNFRFSLTIFKIDGTPVGSCFGHDLYALAQGSVGTFRVLLRDLRLAPGMYYCGLATGRGNNFEGHSDFDIILDVLHFEVMAPDGVEGTRATWHQTWGYTRFMAPEVNRID